MFSLNIYIIIKFQGNEGPEDPHIGDVRAAADDRQRDEAPGVPGREGTVPRDEGLEREEGGGEGGEARGDAQQSRHVQSDFDPRQAVHG